MQTKILTIDERGFTWTGWCQAVCALRPQSIVVKFKILPFGNKM
jgi:hypothetical protein